MPEWTLGAVGDVFVNRPDPANAFRHCAPLLRQIDLVFGNCEGAFTDRPQVRAQRRLARGVRRRNGAGLRAAGFHVMACANNHILDAGHEGLADTLALLHRQGIRTVGAGCDVAAAHAPASQNAPACASAFSAMRRSIRQATRRAKAFRASHQCGSTRTITLRIGTPTGRWSPVRRRKFVPFRIPRMSRS